MTAINWSSAVSGTWGTIGDWTPNQIPGAADAVTISATGAAYTVTLNAAEAANTLLLNSSNATLALSSTLTLGSLLTLSAGTLKLGGTIKGGTISRGAGTLSLLGGTLSDVIFEGTLDLSSQFSVVTLTNGIVLTGAGGTGRGMVNFIGYDSTLDIANTMTIDNATIDIGDHLTSDVLTSVDTTHTGAVLTLGSNLALTQTGAYAGITSGSYAGDGVVNQGTIAAGVSGGQFLVSGGSFTNKGSIAVSNGDTLTIDSTSFANTGTISETNATLIIESNLTTAQLGKVVGSGGTVEIAGTLNNSGATLSLGAGSALGTLTLDGEILGGTVADAGGGLVSADGTLSGVSYQGTLALTGANQSLTIANGISFSGVGGAGPGVVTVTGANTYLSVSGSTTLNNVTINLGSNSNALYSYLYNHDPSATGAVLTLGPQAVVNQVGTYAALLGDLSGGGIVNQGVINAGESGGQLSISPTQFDNVGSIIVSNGAFVGISNLTNFVGTTLSGGSYEVDNGSQILISENNNTTGTVIPITTDNANITLSGMTSTLYTQLFNSSNFTFTNASLDSGLTTITSAGSLHLLAGRGLSSSNALSDAGLLELGGGILQVASLAVAGGGKLLGFGTVSNSVADAGSVEARGGLLDLTGSVSGTGGFTIDSGATLEFASSPATGQVAGFNGAGGTLKMDVPSSFKGTIGSLTSGDTIDLAGITNVTGASISGSTLTVTRSAGAALTYTVSAPAQGLTFTHQSDGSSGTDIVATSGAPNWKSAISGDWSVATDWIPSVVPGSTTSATIAATGAAYTVTVSTPQAVKSLQLNSATATLDVQSDLALGGLLSLTAGALSLEGVITGGTIAAGAAALVANGGTLDNLTYKGPLTVSAGTLALQDSITLTGAGGTGPGTVNVTNATLAPVDAFTFNNTTITLASANIAGAVDYDAGYDTSSITFGPNVLVTQTGGSVTMTAPGIGPGGSVDNQGTISAAVSGGTMQISPENFSNEGTILVGNGETLTAYNYAFVNSGVVNVSSGGLVVVQAIFANSGTVNLNGGGIDLLGDIPELGNIANSGDIYIGGDLENTGSTLEVGTGTALGTLQLYDPTYQDGPGTITGGVIQDFGGGIQAPEGGTLDGVTYEGLLTDTSILWIADGISLTGVSGTGVGTIDVNAAGPFFDAGELYFVNSTTLNSGVINLNGDGSYYDDGPSQLGDPESGAFALLFLYDQAGTGATLTLGANVIVNATAGNLNASYDAPDTIVNQGTLIANGGPLILFETTLTNQGTIIATNGGTFDSYYGVLTNLGTGAAGATLTGGSFEADANSLIDFVTSGAPVVADNANITLSGTGSVIQSSFSTPSYEFGGIYEVVALDSSLTSIGAAGSLHLLAGRNFAATNAISDAGLLQLGGGSFSAPSLTLTSTGTLEGFGTVTGAVANSGAIIAQGGLLKLASAQTGNGSYSIAAGATLELASSPAAGHVVSFTGAGGMLKLDNPASVPATINGFVIGETLDLAGVSNATSASINGSTLTVTRSTGTALSYTISGATLGEGLLLASDGSGGTLVIAATPTANALSWASAVSGNWSTATDWTPVEAPNSASALTIAATGAAYTVSLTAPQAAKSVTLNSAAATLSLTSSLSLTGSLSLSAGTLSLGGTLAGATLARTGGTIVAKSGTLSGVTYQGTLDLSPQFSVVYISNGFAISGAGGSGAGVVNLTGYESELYFVGTETFDNATVSIGNHLLATLIDSDDTTHTGAVLTLGPNLVLNQTASLAGLQSSTYAGDGIVNEGTINATFAGGTFTVAGGSFINQGSIVVGSNESFSVTAPFTDTGAVILQGGTLTAASFNNNGSGFVNGTGTIAGTLTNNATVQSFGGTLKLAAAVNGTGSDYSGSGAVLEFAAGVSAGQFIAFNGPSSTLQLDSPSSFAGTIEGFGPGATIDLSTVANATSASLTSSALTVNLASGSLVLPVSGGGGGLLELASDGHGGTDILEETVPTIPPMLPLSWNLGIVHVGAAAVSQQVNITNIGGPYTAPLLASFSGGSGAITATGSLSVAAGTSGNLLLGLNTTTSGNFTASPTITFAAPGTGNSTLGTTPVGTQQLSVTGTVDNYAVLQFYVVGPSVTGVTGSNGNYTVNLGAVALGSTAPSFTLGVANAAEGVADALSGSFTVSGSSAFTNTGFAGGFSGLLAGAGESGQTVSLSTANTGSFSETITIAGTGSNASGYSGALTGETLTVTGVITPPPGQTYTLTAAPVTITGTSGNDTFVATNATLNSRDRLDGAGGSNTLTLSGGGSFDLGAPAVLANIQTVKAAEGQAASGSVASSVQTVYLRDGTSFTVNVASGTANPADPNPESITIYGAASNDVINLGTGSDLVVLGGAGETVNGGGGTALVQATAALAGALVNGGTSGTTTLEITSGGTAALNAATSHVTVTLDLATNLTLSGMGFVSAVGSSGADTITAMASGQTLTGGAGADTLIGYSGFGDTFKDTVAGLNGDTIQLFGGSDVIDLTDLNPATLQPLSYTGNASAGVLKAADGTHSASINFIGNYSTASFHAPVSDGHGGSLITFV